MEWLGWDELLASLGALVLMASTLVAVIAKWTKTKGDDNVAGWLRKLHDWLSALSLGNQKKLAPTTQVVIAVPPQMLPSDEEPTLETLPMSKPGSKPFQ